MSRAWMQWMTIALALASASCGASSGGREGTLDELRRRADASPNDSEAARAVAIGELLGDGGDASRARARLDRALVLDPDDPAILLLSAVEHDQHGEPGDAMRGYLRTLERVAEHGDARSHLVAEIAASSLEDLSETAPRFAAEVGPALESILSRAHRIGPAASETLHEIVIDLAFRRGERDRAAALAARAGCIPSWRVAGPFGPHELLEFDDPHRAIAPGPLADGYDLGPGRGLRPTRTVTAKGCSVHVGAGPVVAGGTTIAETTIDAPRAGGYVVRIETPNAVELFVDSQSVVRLDARALPMPRVAFVPVTLTQGTHELTVKLSTRHPNPILVVTVTSPQGHGIADVSGGLEAPSGDGSDPSARFNAYLRAAQHLARGSFVDAREDLGALVRAQDAPATLLVLGAAATLSDPLRNDAVRRDDARVLLRRARERDPHAWYAALQLPRLEAAEQQSAAAIAELRTAAETWPSVLAFRLALADLLQSRAWDAEAERTIAAARDLAPDSCVPIKLALDVARRHSRATQSMQLAEQLVACDARSDARFSLLVRARRFDEARSELERLAQFESGSSRFGILNAGLDLARNRGDDAAFDAALAELARLAPRSDSVVLAAIDRQAARGSLADARRTLDTALAAEPAAMADLRRVRAALFGVDDLAAYRQDGARVIRDFEASGRTYAGPQALILDYTVVRVFEDGSTLELTHNIIRVQSEEAVDEQGEFRVPDGARLLTLHTIKPDGRRLEPDEIAGKDTISLPNLAVGDYVEFEYVNTGEPPRAFPNGYLGDRFYFQGFDVPYDRSELTIIMPAAMRPLVDPRGPAPQLEERVEGDLRILHFLVHESRPLTPEPMAVAMREYVPSINVAVGASWDKFVDGVRDVLADRDVRDPAAVRLLAEILGDDLQGSREARARKLYAWVLQNVEDNDDAFGQAASMLAARNGNRARVLRYLLGLADVPAQLGIARTRAADATQSELPDGDTYSALLVRAELESGPRWLSTSDRGAPFGYLSPLVRGMDYRILDASRARGVLVAGAPDADVRSVEVDLALRADASARLDVTETSVGLGAVSWRTQLESIATDELERRFEADYVARLVPGAMLARLDIRGRTEPENPLVLDYSFDVSGIGRRSGNDLALGGIFPTRLAAILARLPSRQTTQLVATPVNVDLTLRVALPDGATVATLPAPVELTGPSGATFNLTTTREGQTIVLRRQVRVPSGRIVPSDYAAFTQFCRAADEAEEREIVVRLP